MLYYMNLRPLVGNARWINEFNPIEYENKGFFNDFLKHLNNLNICCAFVGTFPAYTAGVFHSHNVPTLAIAVRDSFRVDNIFQRNGGCYHSFVLASFRFLYRSVSIYGTLKYLVLYKDAVAEIQILPVPTLTHCDLLSNLNLVHYL
jgi:hypothetical protein